MKRKGTRSIVLTSIAIVTVFIGVLAAMSLLSSTASAEAGYTTACQSCHTYQDGNLRIATDTTTKTVAPGAAFAVAISFTGGGHPEINWPNVLNNTQFSPTPRVPFSANASTGSTSSTLTAPTTPGTYTVRVYSAQASPRMESDYKDMTITVVSAQTTYTITASAGANGSITPSGAVTVNSGASRAFAIAASTGYHVADVLVDGTSVGAVTSYTFSNVTANHTISASFVINTVTTYTITASAGANGSITPSGAVTVNSGASRAFAIAASTGYHVADVLVDGTSVGAVTSYTFSNVTANHTISASFAINAVVRDDESEDHHPNRYRNSGRERDSNRPRSSRGDDGESED